MNLSETACRRDIYWCGVVWDVSRTCDLPTYLATETYYNIIRYNNMNWYIADYSESIYLAFSVFEPSFSATVALARWIIDL